MYHTHPQANSATARRLVLVLALLASGLSVASAQILSSTFNKAPLLIAQLQKELATDISSKASATEEYDQRKIIQAQLKLSSAVWEMEFVPLAKVIDEDLPLEFVIDQLGLDVKIDRPHASVSQGIYTLSGPLVTRKAKAGKRVVLGEIGLVGDDQELYGHLTVNNQVYRILSKRLGAGFILAEIPNRNLMMGGCSDDYFVNHETTPDDFLAVFSTKGREAAPGSVSVEETVNGSGPCIIDVGFGFTLAANQQSNRLMEANAIKDAMNEALNNSGIGDFVQYRVAGTTVLQSSNLQWNRVDNMFTAITSSPQNQEVAQFMSAVGADLFQAVIPKNLNDAKLGRAELHVRREDRDMSAIQAGYINELVGIHELAHNQGCSHQDQEVRSIPLNAAAKAYSRGGANPVSTIVAAGGSPNRIKYFSTPFIIHPVLRNNRGVWLYWTQQC